VLGAPFDEATSTRPGTRFGPRAIREADDGAGPPALRHHLDHGVQPFSELDVVDASDLAVIAGDPAANLARLQSAVASIVGRDAVPVVLGGDHSIAAATIAGAVEASGADGLLVVQLDAHTDTTPPDGVTRARWSHGSPFGVLVEDGVLPPASLVQLGLRGYWPPPQEREWAAARGIRQVTMRELRARGIAEVVEQVLAGAAAGTRLWLSLDIDAVDPAFAPGTGTPEPGGFTSWEILDVVARLTSALPLLGMELVEVSPPYDQSEITAILAHRLVCEALCGVALQRRAARS
jgi:agmatinase